MKLHFSKDNINDYINFESQAFNINDNKMCGMASSAKSLVEELKAEFKDEYRWRHKTSDI